MKFFVDTAKIDDIKKANDMGVICGVTTNPSLIAKEGGRSQEDVLKEIASIVDGPISGEVKATTVDAEGMIAEGREIAKLHPNMVVKIPMTVEGLKATKVLASEGIDVNVTLIFTANQALLAAKAGAAYVSPFLGRLDDISQAGIDLIETISAIFANYPDIDTEIIAASVRNPIHVTDCALAGADIATVPYGVIEQMTKHPLTDQGIAKFQADYKGEIKLCKKYSREPIKDIYAKLVRKGDFFEELIENGQQFVNFKPIPFNSEEVLGAFAIVLYKDGSMMYDTMSVAEIEKTRSTYSKAKNSQAWKESPGEMQKKTVLRRLCKLIDLDFDNIEQRRAFDEGAGVEFEETPSKVMRKGADEDTPADVLGDDNVIDGDFKEVPQEPDAEMYAGIDAMDDGELPFK